MLYPTSCFPSNLSATSTFECRDLEVRIAECADVSRESANPIQEHKRKIEVDESVNEIRSSRCLKFVLTDMHANMAVAFEMTPVYFKASTDLVGSRLVLNGRIDVESGILLLTSGNCRTCVSGADKMQVGLHAAQDFIISESLLDDIISDNDP